jgi:hypothetical protein
VKLQEGKKESELNSKHNMPRNKIKVYKKRYINMMAYRHDYGGGVLL